MSCNESPRTPSILISQDNLPWSFHPLELDGNGSQYFVRTFSEKFHVPLCCAISPDGQFVFSGGEAGDIKVWSLIDDSIVKISQGHTKAVVCCQFSPDGGRAATGSLDGSVFLWNRSWSCTKIIDENPFYPVVSCCFSADGCKILTAINDSVWTYEILTRKREKIFTDCTQSAINSIAVSQNQLAVGTASSSVVIISLDSNEKIFHTGHKGWVHKVAFSESGDRLVSSSEDGFVLVWDTLNEFPSGIKYRKCVDAIFKDDDTVALANRDNSVDIIRNNKKCDTIDATDVGSLITCCVLNHHCDKLAICCENGILKIFDLITGSLQETNNIHAKRILCCQFSFDDSVLATGSEDCHIGLIADRNLTRSCRSILCHTESIVAIKFFNDDTKLLTCSYDQTLVVLEISTGNILFNCCGHEGSVVACDITSDNQIIGSASVDQTAKIWNSINGYVINTLHHDACVRSCRFSPNCSLLITGDDNGEIRIWDLSQNIMDTPIFKLKNALTSCWVNELLISSDSKTLLAASDSIKWWDIKSGSCLQTFPIQGNLLRHVCASPRFEKFVAVDNANVFYYLKKIMLPICQ